MNTSGFSTPVHNIPNNTIRPFIKFEPTSRIDKEFNELEIDPIPLFKITKNPSTRNQWHFVLQGLPNSPFEGGEYHGDIIFPKTYPIDPPLVIFNCYNGRILKGEKMNPIEPEWWNASMMAKDGCGCDVNRVIQSSLVKWLLVETRISNGDSNRGSP